MRARPAGDEQVAPFPLLRVDGRVLVEDGAPVRLHHAEPAGHDEVERVDDGVLRHVLLLVGLRVVVGDIGVLVVVVEPVLAARELLVGHIAVEVVERVAGFVDKGGRVVDGDVAHHGDVAFGVVAPG